MGIDTEKIEEHEYHTNRPKVSNSTDWNWTVNDGNSRIMITIIVKRTKKLGNIK